MANDDLKIRIGKQIKKKRIELGYSREQLADMANITSRFLFDIETGNKGMSLNTFDAIRQALGVSADWLLDK